MGGAESRNRTDDTRFFRPVLYQLSYLGISGIEAVALFVPELSDAFGDFVSSIFPRRSDEFSR